MVWDWCKGFGGYLGDYLEDWKPAIFVVIRLFQSQSLTICKLPRSKNLLPRISWFWVLKGSVLKWIGIIHTGGKTSFTYEQVFLLTVDTFCPCRRPHSIYTSKTCWFLFLIFRIYFNNYSSLFGSIKEWFDRLSDLS